MKKASRTARRIAIGLGLVCFLLLAARSSVARMYRVQGASDAPTLLIGDRVWVNLAAYDLRLPFTSHVLITRGEPRRGDMVLCRLPGQRAEFLKRVVAVGGDTVELRHSRLIVNGQSATYESLEPAMFEDIPAANRMGDCFAIERIDGSERTISYSTAGSPVSDFGPVTVPGDRCFVLGDNRDNSYDSRADTCGCLPRAEILGRAIGLDDRP